MPYRTFLTYNVLGGLIWGGGVTFLGYYLGEKVPGISEYITPIVLAIVFLTSLPLLLRLRRRSSNTTATSV
jgi:membrane-associated protein